MQTTVQHKNGVFVTQTCDGEVYAMGGNTFEVNGEWSSGEARLKDEQLYYKRRAGKVILEDEYGEEVNEFVDSEDGWAEFAFLELS